MQEAVLSPLATWQNFYVLIGSAAAALTGLTFVVVTLSAVTRQTRSSVSGGMTVFSTPTVMHFCAVLLVAAIFSAPWPALWPAGLLLGLCGLAGMTYVVIVLRRLRRQTAYQPVLEDCLWYTAFPLVVAGMVLPGNAAPALSSSVPRRFCSCSSVSTTRGIP